ncbi:MAG: NAD(P)-dependent oxidoreductase [Acholeplasmatales bacterium]|nr:MAG: NAD(P)-dependent oxidoreductase [Acholeplasmatales bacterium]
MKVIVFGATGKTGLAFIEQALEEGFEVTAFVRDATRLLMDHERLSVVRGDILHVDAVEQALKGQEAVVCTLGAGRSLKKTTIRERGTINIIRGMHNNDVNRLLVVSAMGIGESWDRLSGFNKFIFATLLKNTRKDHEAQERVVKNSHLDYTIIRPSGLTDAPRTGLYMYGENVKAKTAKIARADVADLMLKALKENSLLKKAVTITQD